jgi:hypothetical protein
MDYSYSRLKTKVQKCSVDMMVMKAENEHLKKFKEEITLKQLEMERHVIAQQQMYTQMQMELECELRKYRQMHEELKLQKVDGDKRVYTLEAELFLSKMAEEDLANENEELKQEKCQADKVSLAAARHAKDRKRSTRRHVLEAFQWEKDTADPVLLEAACAFWDALGAREEGDDYSCENVRVSSLQRKIAWKAITLKGWNGDMEKQLEAEFILKKRYCAISIAKTSDLESKFNVKVASDLAKCDPSREKYERSFLPSDMTCRRIMQRVFNEAQNIGFASFPLEQKGNVWCWGDADGNFKNGVNRYIYETYYKLHSTVATRDCPWCVCVTGDEARVNFRGKGITMCGVKQSDPRLPSQFATGKTMNQSRNLYSPAVAGYTNEKSMMPYFEEMVAAFVDIEKKGYCTVEGVNYPIFIRCIVVADMSFLHKYLGRGGGSAKTICFCFMCSSKCHYRHKGYPGGCWKCRRLGCVYDDETGVQKCPHHDVCTPEFLSWEKDRFEDLGIRVSHKIPLCKLPPWESVPALRLECSKRCKDEKDHACVNGMTTEAKLQRWLLTRCKRELSFYSDFLYDNTD